MDIFLIVLFLLLLYVSGPRLISTISKGRKNTLFLAGAMSLILIPVNLLLLNQHELVADEQNKAIGWTATVTESAGNRSSHEQWVKDNFLFIDDSYSNQLLPLPGANQLGSSTIVVTNRAELTKLFLALAEEDSLVDLIVCDIFFDISSANDSLLRDAMTKQLIRSKLVIASNALSSNTGNFASFNDSVYGFINEKEIDGRFATYSPVRNNRATMAYQVYRKMFPPGKTGLNSYIPHFHLTSEDSLYVREEVEEESAASLADKNYQELGDLVTATGAALLHAVLQQRKQENKRNVIFIGSFKGEETDVHPTYFGRLHGPTIILNLIYSLYKGQHRTPFGYLLYLWIGIAIVLYFTFRQAVSPVRLPGLLKKRTTPAGKNTALKYTGKMVAELTELVAVKLIFSSLLVFFIVATVVFWDRILNGFVLFILLHFIHVVLHHFASKAGKKH